MTSKIYTSKTGQTQTFEFTHEGLMDGLAFVESQPEAWNSRAGAWFLSNLGANVKALFGRSADEMLTDAWMILTNRTFDNNAAGEMASIGIDITEANDAVKVLFFKLTRGAYRARTAENAVTGVDALRNGNLPSAMWIDADGIDALEDMEAATEVPGSDAHLDTLTVNTNRRGAAGLAYVSELLQLAGLSRDGAAAVLASVATELAKCTGVEAAAGTEAHDAAMRNAVSYISKNAELATQHGLELVQWRSLVTLLLGNTTGLPGAVQIVTEGGDFAEHKHIRMAAKKLAAVEFARAA